MADSLFDVLSRKDFDEPAELRAIKRYIAEHFERDVEVGFQGNAIVVTVPSAALAGTLRYHVRAMQQAAATDKRIVLRIR